MHGFATAGYAASGFVIAGLVAAGFKALGLAASGLAAVGFKQRHVQHPDAAELTHVTKTAECNASKSDVGKGKNLSCATSGRFNKQLILLIKYYICILINSWVISFFHLM